MAEEKRKKEEREKKVESSDGKSEEVKGEDGEAKEEKSDKQKPLPGNGGYTDKYRWAQTLEELTVNVNLPDNVEAK